MTIGFGSSSNASRGSKNNWDIAYGSSNFNKRGVDWILRDCPFEPPGFLEIGWWLDESCWGQGYATEAAKVVLDYAINGLASPN